MILYPAVDIMEGKCVRLTQGKRAARTVYYEDPAEPAKKWVSNGAKWLHVIDLDAALDAQCFVNRPAIERILKAVDVPVQVGGGVRTPEDVQTWLDIGVARVIVGTKALASREFATEIFSSFGDRVAVSIDSRDGFVALRGWQDASSLPTERAVREMSDAGAKVIILTDIRRDGMLTEPDFGGLSDSAAVTKARIIAAGGVSTVEHVDRLAAIGHANINGAIIGKGLYEGTFDFKAAIAKYPRGK